jgi:putative Mg2+ transporter-C (MgtC) family protein
MDTVAVPATFVEMAGRLVLATVLGGLVGLNRETAGKPAGLRTNALVSLAGGQLAVVALLFGEADAGAPSRVLQGVLAGVGFIGAGVILHRGDAQGVHGLTTAAAIWVVAAIGVAAGAGLWRTAATTAAITLIVLMAGEALDRRVHHDEPPR